MSSNYPKEDVFGGVKSGCIYASGVGWVPFTDNAAGETGDGALCDGGVFSLLASCYCISHHKVYGTLSGTSNLQNSTVII